MKMLMFHVRTFQYRTHTRNLESEEEREEAGETEGPAVLSWLQVESADLEDAASCVRRIVKNLKWHARKVDVPRIVLHSFAHLSSDRADPEGAQAILREVAERLRSVDYEVIETPWGYFNEFQMHVEGPGIAKVFKEW